MDWETVARQWIRAARGKRSQAAFSRRLGYRSNVLYTWESGRRFPTAAELLRGLTRAGVDVRGAVGRFYRAPPPWLATAELGTREGVATLLMDLRGSQAVARIAEAAGRSRFAVTRWLRGEAEPRVPDFLRLVDALSLRALDLIAATVDMAQVPVAAPAWARLEAQRRAAWEAPWTQAVLRALELEAGPRTVAEIASRLRVPEAEVAAAVTVLFASGEVQEGPDGLRSTSRLAVDTRRDAERGLRLKSFWARVGLERLEAGDEGLFSYNVFTVSEADLERLRVLHRAYFRELRAVIASSSPGERVCVANVQLFALDPA